MSNQYRRGRRLEYQVKKDLESEGWTVLRTAGSHGFADLVALRGANIKFIQCKLIAKQAQLNMVKKAVLSDLPKPGLADVSHELIVKIKGTKNYESYARGIS